MLSGKCKLCGKVWVARNRKKFCSVECAVRGLIGNPRITGRPRKLKIVVRHCPICGNDFECKRASEILTKVYCSRKCAAVYVRQKLAARTEKIARPCRTCGEVMEVLPSRKETKWYCSRTCKWAEGSEWRKPRTKGNSNEDLSSIASFNENRLIQRIG